MEPPVNQPLDVLAVMAHPDDAELLCGGSLVRSADAGERTGVVDLTRGESGTHGSAEERAREAETASEVLGLAVRRNAGLPDAGLTNTPASRRVVVEILRDLRPRVVVTHARSGRHPDHRVAAELVYDACYLAGLVGLEAGGAAHRPLKVVHATAFREDAGPPDFVVDVTDQMDRKIQALQAYASQFDGRTAMGEVFPGGGRPLYDQIRAACAVYGSRIRVGYGEPYQTRETLRAETLGSLPVSTF
jgi:bacillithiol biosynthesis deacetylase BshB1